MIEDPVRSIFTRYHGLNDYCGSDSEKVKLSIARYDIRVTLHTVHT